MDQRRQLILFELKKQCTEKQQDEFEYYWEIWGGVNWYPWFLEFSAGDSLVFTANDVSSDDLNHFVEIGELEVVKVYDPKEMTEEFDRVRFRLIK